MFRSSIRNLQRIELGDELVSFVAAQALRRHAAVLALEAYGDAVEATDERANLVDAALAPSQVAAGQGTGMGLEDDAVLVAHPPVGVVQLDPAAGEGLDLRDLERVRGHHAAGLVA